MLACCLNITLNTSLGIIAQPAKLIEWALVLHGTEADPLEVASGKKAKVNDAVKNNIKSRDQIASSSDSTRNEENMLDPDWRDTLAQSGIIIPQSGHVTSTEEKPYVHPTYQPPTYKPANRPKFEYVWQRSREDNHLKEETPLIFRHGDHIHKVSSWSGSVHDELSRNEAEVEADQVNIPTNPTSRGKPLSLSCCHTLLSIVYALVLIWSCLILHSLLFNS